LCRWPGPPTQRWPGKPGVPRAADLRRRGVLAYLCQRNGWHLFRYREKIRRCLPRVYSAYVKRYGQWKTGGGRSGRAGATSKNLVEHRSTIGYRADMARERTFSDQIRRAVDECGMSRYALCKLTGMDKAVMSRFMSGKGFLSEGSLNALAKTLRLTVRRGNSDFHPAVQARLRQRTHNPPQASKS
jgi:hypothetical protein